MKWNQKTKQQTFYYWIVGEGSSNRNASRDESVETGDESVEIRNDFIEIGENTTIML